MTDVEKIQQNVDNANMHMNNMATTISTLRDDFAKSELTTQLANLRGCIDNIAAPTSA